MFDKLRGKKFNIYLLEDTHFESNMDKDLEADWGYECFFASKNSQSRGVGILFNNNFEYKKHKIYKGDGGNFIFASISAFGKKYLIGAIYGPNKDNPDFYQNLTEFLKQNSSDSEIILGGDFNVIIDQNLDSENYKRENNPKAREKIEEMMISLDLTDVWRDMNPDVRRYTWRRKNPQLQQGRLDYFLISESLML